MLEQLNLYHFQTHESKKIRLDPRVTIIRGPTDSGKSSIFRALRWLALNDNYESSFIRKGSDNVKVTLKVDGVWVSRFRGKKNKYKLGDQEFHAVGRNVPEPISDLLQLKAENFQGQFDPTYWLADSASQVSRNLNAIVNLEVMDKFLTEVNAINRKSQTAYEIAIEQYKEAKAEEENTRWIDNFLELYQQAESLQVVFEECSEKIDRLSTLLAGVNKAKIRFNSAKKRLPLLENASRLATQWLRLDAKRERLFFLVKEIRNLESKRHKPIPKINKLLVKEKTVYKLEEKTRRLHSLLTTIDELESCLQKEKQRLNKLSKKLKNCPICGSKLTSQ